MVPVRVANLSLSNVGFVVLLRSEEDDRTLPIYIGPPEAQSILFRLNNVNLPRPITHDLLKSVLDALEARLERVDIHDLKDNTFYGKLILSFEGQTLEVDSRPSDAIALALRCHAPIFVAEAVMDEGAVVMEEDRHGEEEKEPAEPENPVTVLKAKLQKAIEEERYEDAATLRDEISKATSTN